MNALHGIHFHFQQMAEDFVLNIFPQRCGALIVIFWYAVYHDIVAAASVFQVVHFTA